MAINAVKTSEVRSILGEPSTALSGLCTSGKVRHWSKFKPMNLDGEVYQLIARMQSDAAANEQGKEE